MRIHPDYPRVSFRIFLSWDSFNGFTAPPPHQNGDHLLPKHLNASSASCCYTTYTFRPHVFSTSRRLTPVTALQIYFTPMSAMGFVTFPNDSTVASDAYPHLSRNAGYTPRRIPLTSCRTTSLWPLPSCCYLALYTDCSLTLPIPS